MKKILFLLLFTIASYGQAVFDEGIQLTNTESTTATKVNVQEANGKVNTKTINTAFNKNFGLNTGDVVGANTLLNQYSTIPIDWTATAFNSGQVVFYAGKQWIAKIATVAGDVPAVSSKWEEITFEALANKTVTVDQTIIDGSTNAVSGNAVFDALATKAPISSVHNPVTLGTANGLSLSTQQLSLGLASSGTTGALSGTDWNTFNSKFNTPTGLTPNYLPKWNGSVFGNSSVFDNGTNIGIGTATPTLSKLQTKGNNGSLIGYFYNNTGTPGQAYGVLIEAGTNTYDFALLVNSSQGSPYFKVNGNGNSLFGTLQDNGVDQVQVNGTISASPATTANQVVIKSQLDAKLNTPTGLTPNYLPKWNGSVFGNSSVFDNGTNIGIGTTNPTANLTVKGAYSVGSSIPTNWALLSAGRMGVANNNKGLYFDIFNGYAEVSTYDWGLGQAYPMVFQGNGGNSMFGTNVDNGVDRVQVAGTISASPATTANQVPTWGQVQAVAGISGSYTPTASVITGATGVIVGSHTYTKIGNIVTVYGESKPSSVVAAVGVVYEISLPIARANTVIKAIGFGGINVPGASINQHVRLESSSTTTARIAFNVNAAGTPTLSYSFQYDITQ